MSEEIDECPECGNVNLWDWKGKKNCGICGWREWL
jgi:ribosomal protein S27AE